MRSRADSSRSAARTRRDYRSRPVAASAGEAASEGAIKRLPWLRRLSGRMDGQEVAAVWRRRRRPRNVRCVNNEWPVQRQRGVAPAPAPDPAPWNPRRTRPARALLRHSGRNYGMAVMVVFSRFLDERTVASHAFRRCYLSSSDRKWLFSGYVSLSLSLSRVCSPFVYVCIL